MSHVLLSGEFIISFTYVSQNGTGTGEIDLAIETVDGIPEGRLV